MMEQYATVDFPFDELFGESDRDEDEEPAPKPAPVKAAPPKKEVPAKAAPKVKMSPCENCGKPFPDTDTTCPHCGTVYELAETE